MISKYIYRFIIVKNKNSYTNKACKINTGNNPLLFFGLSGISVVFPVIRVFPVSLGTPKFRGSRNFCEYKNHITNTSIRIFFTLSYKHISPL